MPCCVDGLKGFPEAIKAVFPQTQVQLCIVHLVRHSLFYVSHKDRKEVATDLKLIYQAAILKQAELKVKAVKYIKQVFVFVEKFLFSICNFSIDGCRIQEQMKFFSSQVHHHHHAIHHHHRAS